jgi:glycosyltransferase involved in cell wall biosynthesis
VNKTDALVTIIMPAYNAQEYIHESINSVLNQTYQNWELVVINDGSTDTTSQTVSSFGDQRIFLIEQKNKGVSAARNAGLDIARGEYITFLDADDSLPPESLEARVRFLESHTDIDVVDGRIAVKDENMHKTLRKYVPYYTGPLFSRLIALDDRVFFNVCYMFKQKILKDIRFKEGMSHGEDLLFYLKLSNGQSVRYGYVNSEVYRYRSGHDSAMANLKGLEAGYKMLIYHVSRLSTVSLWQKSVFRLKIAKIMFLSWCSQKSFVKAIKSAVSLLLGVDQNE